MSWAEFFKTREHIDKNYERLRSLFVDDYTTVPSSDENDLLINLHLSDDVPKYLTCRYSGEANLRFKIIGTPPNIASGKVYIYKNNVYQKTCQLDFFDDNGYIDFNFVFKSADKIKFLLNLQNTTAGNCEFFVLGKVLQKTPFNLV
jgi:hypothetical protein